MTQFTSYLPNYAIEEYGNLAQFNCFECLYKICSHYKPSQLFSSRQFLDDILGLTIVNDWKSRLIAYKILHLLLDKHQLLDKVKKRSLFSSVDLDTDAWHFVVGDSIRLETKRIVEGKNANKYRDQCSKNNYYL